MDPASSNSMSIPNPLRDVPHEATASSNACGIGATEGTTMGAVMNPAEDADGSHKRTAMAGQWRTPENLLFPATVGSSTSLASGRSAGSSTFMAGTAGMDTQRTTSSFAPSGGVVAPNSNPPAMSTTSDTTATAMVVDATSSIGSMPLPLQAMALPDSTEDYAKALQEAYRRGAEAAAALAAQQQQQQQQFNLAPSASCPDFQQTYSAPTVSGQRTSPTVPTASSGYVGAPQTVVSAPHAPQPAVTTSGGAAPHVPSPITAPTMTTSASHPVLTSHSLFQPQVPQQQQQQQPQQSQQPAHVPPHQHHPMMPPPPAPTTVSSFTMASTVVTAPAPPQYQPMQVQAPPPATGAAAAAPASLVRNSLSMPNMGPGVGLAHHPNPYHAGLVEEEKRLKRLARNRASARLRRLRKKNLVDAYETEVGILEKTLQALKHHEWGTTLLEAGGASAPTASTMSALTEALSMDRGQQALTKQERKDAAVDILRQQLEFVSLLEQIMQEQFVLHQVGSLLQGGSGGPGDMDAMESDVPSRALLQELVQELQLSPEQMQQLQSAQSGWEEEYSALQTVKQSLLAMINSNWLWNEGSTAVVEEFMSILHKNQVSKFLLWADANVEAIDELDGVNAPPAVPQGPVFTFGVNNNPESLLDDEKA